MPGWRAAFRSGATILVCAFPAMGAALANDVAGSGTTDIPVISGDAQLLIFVVLLIITVLLLFIFYVHNQYMRFFYIAVERLKEIPGTSSADVIDILDRIRASPGAVPEGTFRGVVAVTVVVAALLGLIFGKSLGLADNTAELTGVLGVILGFYFGARQSAGAGEALREANRQISRNAAEIVGSNAAAQEARQQQERLTEALEETRKGLDESERSKAETDAKLSSRHKEELRRVRRSFDSFAASLRRLPEGSPLAGALEASRAEIEAWLDAAPEGSLQELESALAQRIAQGPGAILRDAFAAAVGAAQGALGDGVDPSALYRQVGALLPAAAGHQRITQNRAAARILGGPITSALLPLADLEELIPGLLMREPLQHGIAGRAFAAADDAGRVELAKALAQACAAAEPEEEQAAGLLAFFASKVEWLAAVEELRRGLVDAQLDADLLSLSPEPSATLRLLDRFAEDEAVQVALEDLLFVANGLLDDEAAYDAIFGD